MRGGWTDHHWAEDIEERYHESDLSHRESDRSTCGPADRLDLDETPCRRGRSETTESGLPVLDRHTPPHLAHYIDHLIGWNREVEPSECHLGSGYRLHRGRGVPIDTGHLDESTDRVTDQAEHTLQGEGDSGGDLFIRTTTEPADRCCAHRCRSACLRLAPTLCPREGGAMSDDTTDPTSDEHRIY